MAGASLLGTISESAAPSINLSVKFIANFEVADGHTVYQIEVSAPNGPCWMIHKRYSEIRQLHDTLRLWLGDGLPQFPPRRLFGNHDPAFLQERQNGLQRYINYTLNLIRMERPNLLGFVCQFLGYVDQTSAVQRGRTTSTAHRIESCVARSGGVEAARRPSAASGSSLRVESESSHSMPPAPSQVQTAPRARRWSRRHQRVADDTGSEAEGGAGLQDTPVASFVGGEGEKMETPNKLRAAYEDATPPGPPGTSWDWPMSRHEKRERLRLIDHHVTYMDKKALIGEIEHLRAESCRSDNHSTIGGA